jgi:hypothetical protein
MHQPAAFLGLGRNQISDIGVAAIAYALKYNQQLQELHLGNDQMMMLYTSMCNLCI